MIDSLDVISIATNGYDIYFLDLIKSADEFLKVEQIPTFHIFTDSPNSIKAAISEIRNLDICIHEIPSYIWPEATLVRYEIIYKNRAHFTAKVLMYVDSDMLFKSNVGNELKPDDWKGGLAFVLHPGFWRKNNKVKILSLKDFFRRIKHGGLGTWEDRIQSTAYVPRNLRKHYCCGGIWMGLRNNIVEFTKLMYSDVEEDKLNGITAIWHDESHLNKYVASNSPTLIGPDYCFDPIYKNLKVIKPRIEAVRKS